MAILALLRMLAVLEEGIRAATPHCRVSASGSSTATRCSGPFVGVEPTNITPNLFRFAERILTAIQTLRLQKHNALEFLGRTLRAYREGGAKPVLCGAG